jgi:iron complex outermembrane receptor protein
MILSRTSGAANRSRLLSAVRALSLACVALPVPVSAAVAAAADGADAAPTDIIVTGTRTQRTVADSAVPIDVLDAKQLEATGKLNLRDALQQSIPSYYNASGWTGGTGEAIKSASLRGLNSDQTLILVNGKRRHNHAVLFVTARGNLGASPVDLDLIPQAAIQRVEVLRDGAAAQYGSDAIAGVINIILKKGGDDGAASITYGQYLHHDNIPGKTGQQEQLSLNQGFNIGQNGGFIRLSTNIDIHDYTNGLGATAACDPAFRAYTCLYAAGDPREQTASRYVGKQGLPRGQTYDFGYNAELPLSPDVTLYSYTTFAHQYSQNFGIFRTESSQQNLRSIYPDGYLPQFKVITNDVQGVLGLRGDLGAWNWDLSSSYSYVHATLRNDEGLNPSLGPSSPRNFYLGALVATEWTNNLDITRDIDTGLAKPLNLAFGLEYRRNHFEQRAGDPASYEIGNYTFPSDPTDPDYIAANVGKHPSGGASGLGGFSPTALGRGHRDNIAAYIDLDQQITSRWDVDLAGRFEHYSDVGTTWSGKIATRYELFRGFALRGSFSNGFRAPSLQQESYSSILPNYVQQGTAQVLSTIHYVPANSAVAQAIGATPLKPERSRDLSVGFTAQPVSRLNITLDAYQINISHRILATGNLLTTDPTSPFAQALVSVGANPVDTFVYFTNAANTRTRGIDLVAEYTTDFGPDWGKVKWSLTNSYNKTTIRSLAPTPSVLSGSGLTVFDRSRIGDLTKAYPKDRVIFGANWQVGKFDLDLRENWYSKTVFVDPTTPARDSTNKAAFTTDAEVSYQLTKSIALTVGANNVFNKFPSQLNAQAKLYYGWFAQQPVYNLTAPYGFNGGFYYGRVSFSW